jgi:drug/metabolite transporter (DMT)-like permease
MMRSPIVLVFALTIAASTLHAAGLLMMKVRAGALPLAWGAGMFRAVAAWARDPGWIGGIGLQLAGYLLYFVALAGAPVSLVAVAMQGGIGLFFLFAIIFLGERASAAEWTGIASVVLAMAMLAGSVSGGEAEQIANPFGLVVISSVLLGAATVLGFRLGHGGYGAAIVAGVAFGLAALYSKALTQLFLAERDLTVAARLVCDPYLYLVGAANAVGLISLQNGFRRARGIVVMPLSSALSSLVPIAGGILAFGERIPSDPAAAALRVGAFVLTIAASALLALGEKLNPG